MTVSKPTSPAEVFDALQRHFGVGNFDEDLTPKPYWKIRATEVSKIKAMMRRRHVTIEDLQIALDYALRHRPVITECWHLFDLIADARKEAREQAAGAAQRDVRQMLTEAAAEAMATGEHGWAMRLFNADTTTGRDLLAQWNERNQ